MRLTVKAKLAGAFGAVIILSMVTGAVAYVKLNQLAAASTFLADRAARIARASEIQASVLEQVQADKNMIIASTDAEIAENAAEIKKQRVNALRLRDELLIGATEGGKTLLAKFSAVYEKMNMVEDNVVKLAELNSSARADQFWSGEGVAAAKGFNDALDAAIASVNRAPASAETGRALFALQTVRLRGVRTLRILYEAISASSEDELAGYLKDLAAENDILAKSLEQATSQVSALGLPVDEFTAQTVRLHNDLAHGAEIVREGGHVKAATLSRTDGRAAVAGTMAVLGEYNDWVKQRMTDATAQAAQDANEGELILIATVIGSLLIAIGSAFWISLNISRGLGRAARLTAAVAAGDLTQTIEVKSDDEIGDVLTGLRDMCDKLRAIITETTNAAQNVASGSQELSASAEQLSQGATEQAAATEEASTSMEEMAVQCEAERRQRQPDGQDRAPIARWTPRRAAPPWRAP